MYRNIFFKFKINFFSKGAIVASFFGNYWSFILGISVLQLLNQSWYVKFALFFIVLQLFVWFTPKAILPLCLDENFKQFFFTIYVQETRSTKKTNSKKFNYFKNFSAANKSSHCFNVFFYKQMVLYFKAKYFFRCNQIFSYILFY